MRITLEGKRSSIFEKISSSPEATEAVLKTKPGRLLLAHLLNRTKVKRIICSRGIYRTFSAKMLSALENIRVRIEISGASPGRPVLYDEKLIEKARAMLKKGKTRKEAAKELGISERNLYYRLKKFS